MKVIAFVCSISTPFAFICIFVCSLAILLLVVISIPLALLYIFVLFIGYPFAGAVHFLLFEPQLVNLFICLYLCLFIELLLAFPCIFAQ